MDSTTRQASFQPSRAAVESRHPAAYNLRSILIPAGKESMTKRTLTMTLFTSILSVVGLCLFPLHVSGQTPAEIQTIANRTAERVAKTRQLHLFVAGLQECQMDPAVCALFEASVRAGLEKIIPGVRFIKRESVINILEGRGFIALDAYFPDVLKAVATSAGADILVTDSLQWQSDGYELTSEIYDAVQGKKLEQFRAMIPRPAPDSGGEPLVFKDPEGGASMIIARGRPSRAPSVEYPVCEKCPEAQYTPEARANRIQGRVLLMLTVTEQGTVQQIGIIDGLGDGLTDQALEAVQSWHFKPATGKDGKPFATRMPVEVTFRLQ